MTASCRTGAAQGGRISRAVGADMVVIGQGIGDATRRPQSAGGETGVLESEKEREGTGDSDAPGPITLMPPGVSI